MAGEEYLEDLSYNELSEKFMSSWDLLCVRIIGSVKAHKPNHLVEASDVRELIGVLSTDLQATKGVVTTTSDFAPKIKEDPSICPLVPHRLELINGHKLLSWFRDLANF